MKKTLVMSLLLFLVALPAFAGAEAKVELFSPQGAVKDVRQVSVRFSGPMAPFGDPRTVEPFAVSCSEKGTGRWADSRNWVYDFEKNIPAGVLCTFTLKPEMKTISGEVLTGERQFSFSTGGPAIRSSRPYEGSDQISEDQAFLLTLDALPDEASVIENVSFSVQGIQERIGVRIVKGEEEKHILHAHQINTDDTPRILIAARQTFPNQAQISLVWGRGVKTVSGVATEQDQILPFKTRPPFNASFHCRRENPRAGCIPMLPMDVRFSSPVSWSYAAKTTLKGDKGKIYKATLSDDERGDEIGEAGRRPAPEQFVRSVRFTGPFPEHATFSVGVPEGMKDDAGRSLANADRFPLSVKTGAYPPLAKFSSRFGIIELSEGAVLPVTLRNLEPSVTARQLKAGEMDRQVIEKLKESALDEMVKIGEAVNKILPEPAKDAGDKMVKGLKGRLHQVKIEREEQIIRWLRIVHEARRSESIFKSVPSTKPFSIPKPLGGRAFEVVGLPLKAPGFYVVEMESRILGASLLGKPQPMYVPTSALVTNLTAHFKWGKESSVVWVTTLDAGMPVKDADVSIRDCAGKMLWTGKTDMNGIARVKGSLPAPKPHCDASSRDGGKDESDPGYESPRRWMTSGAFVFAKKGDDLTFVHTSWDQGIEPYQFNLPDSSYRGPILAASVLDRKLLRAGETIHMKHFLRKQTMRGLSLADRGAYPKVVSIRHAGSRDRYEFPLRWDAGGVAETTWEIPRGAKLGVYDIHLLKELSVKRKAAKRPETTETDDERGEDDDRMTEALASGSFRVEEFRVPLMKGLIQPPAAPLVNVSEADLDVMVAYLAGGGASHEEVKLRSDLRPRSVSFNDYEGVTFANGLVSEGISKGVYTEEGVDEGSEPSEERQAMRKKAFKTLEIKLDRAGAARARVTNIERVSTPHDINAELEFRDPSGEVQTVSRNIPLWPAKVVVGVKPDSWALSRDALKFHAIALGLDGKPVSQALIKVDLYQKKHYSHRKRLIGGFYSYSHWTETRRIGPLCEGRTDGKGLLVCQVKSPLSGQVVLQAQTIDDAGNVSAAHQDVWIAEKGDWWFRQTDNDRIDLLPEKKRYEPGETAKFQVRMPFRRATVLMAIEREGVVETFVKELSGEKPVIEIPVKKSYAPNIYVSVLCVRGRVTDVQPTATVDLGKPAFKLGIAEIKVGWQAHELKVSVTTEKKEYRIRQNVPVRIKVVQAANGAPYKGAEVALAAVDEGLLELMANDSWKLLEAMMAERGYGVRTSTAQMQVVGKRHFGLKAIPHGGGGGKQITRELFDTLLLWKARIPLDEKGEAEVQVPLNDALTSFRIVAVASGGPDKFGTGQTSISSTQDLLLLSGLSPMVREGDRFRAGFTVRNASGRPMQVEVRAKLIGAQEALAPIDVDLMPGAAQEIAWDVAAPAGKERLEWEVSAAARDGSGSAEDRLRAVQYIAAAIPVRIFQATIVQADKPVAFDVERPQDALPHKGGIQVSTRAKLVGGLSGVSYYMKHYPYTCMEQKVSRAIALQDGDLWKKVAAELPSHLDRDGLVKYFPRMPYGYDSLTTYILAIAHEAGLTLPEDVGKKMEDGLRGFIEGRVIRHSSMPTADLSIRKVAALEALSRYGRAEAKLLSAINVEADLWPTSAVLDWMNILTRMEAIPDREARRAQAEQIIRSRLTFQGTTMLFSTERMDNLWWLMQGGDVNAVRTVLTFLADEKWKEDMPRLVRGALGRMHRGAWGTTTANAWGVLSMKKFSDRYESQSVTGATAVGLDRDERTILADQTAKNGSVDFRWPDGKKPLSVRHEGEGKPWVTIQSLAAIPLKQPFSSGYTIKKILSPVVQKTQGKWSRGDAVRVRLELTAQADMTWVVVNDPIPAGSSILGTGLGRDSTLLTQGERATGWTWPAFEERSFEAFRAYYEYVPKGAWSVEYTVRLNNPGTFHLPETRVEALYAPEMFGEMPNAAVVVQP